MKKAKYIIDLAKRNLTIDGYDYIVSLVKYYLNKYNWPKVILDENSNTALYWTDEEVLSFTQQLLTYVLEKEKLKNYKKIPESYIEYYFKTIIVSFVANKIKAHQNKLGLSFDDTKRISLEILNEHYFSDEIVNIICWNKENVFINPILNNDRINEILTTLPKIPITEKTRHYKPRVKTALNDVFTLINRPIKQSVLINQVFKLFDQSSFARNDEEEIVTEIREDEISCALEQIVSKVVKKDIPIYLDYFFSETETSLSFIAKKHNLPKSTVHYKINQFTKFIFESFKPNNDEEGVQLLENLHKTLDELK